MRHSPTFSIVIPTRNGERYIGSAIASVLDQTYPHFRLFILESGSTDKTCEIVRSFDDARVQLLTVPESLGIEENWARILDLNLDPYLTILGHDDVFYPEFLEETIRLIEREPEASLYFTHFDYIDAHGAVMRSCFPIPYQENADDFLFNLHEMRRDSFASGYVMRSDDYRLLGGYPAFPGLMYADYFITYQLAAISYKVCSPRTLFAVRQHESSMSFSVGLAPIFQSSRQYLNALERTTHWTSLEHQASARRGVRILYLSHKHRIQASLIARGNTTDIQQYRATKSQLQKDNPGDYLLYGRDWVSLIYEVILGLPRPTRGLVYRVVALLRKLRKWQFQAALDWRNRRRIVPSR